MLLKGFLYYPFSKLENCLRFYTVNYYTILIVSTDNQPTVLLAVPDLCVLEVVLVC